MIIIKKSSKKKIKIKYKIFENCNYSVYLNIFESLKNHKLFYHVNHLIIKKVNLLIQYIYFINLFLQLKKINL